MKKYIVAYDIQSNTKRTKLVKILEKYGMIRIQLSVFCGMIKDKIMKKMNKEIRGLTLGKMDSVISIRYHDALEEIVGNREQDMELESELIII
jgi:CRISPR-associated endonuclease Cas2